MWCHGMGTWCHVAPCDRGPERLVRTCEADRACVTSGSARSAQRAHHYHARTRAQVAVPLLAVLSTHRPRPAAAYASAHFTTCCSGDYPWPLLLFGCTPAQAQPCHKHPVSHPASLLSFFSPAEPQVRHQAAVVGQPALPAHRHLHAGAGVRRQVGAGQAAGHGHKMAPASGRERVAMNYWTERGPPPAASSCS